MYSGSPDNSTSVNCLDLQGVEFSCPLHQGRNFKVANISIKERLVIFKGRSNISTNKYDILILPGTLFIC